jgi:hypothetical protein
MFLQLPWLWRTFRAEHVATLLNEVISFIDYVVLDWRATALILVAPQAKKKYVKFQSLPLSKRATF